ncbi:MAG: hypothetical protein L0Y70_10110, partial [Gemmataceae bacterium]|nr:hypothetical protein [Gemmataceae bacterium]
PRLASSGLALLGLASVLERRFLVAGLLFTAGALLHPIMAAMGIGVALVWALWNYLPTRWSIALTCTGAAAIVAVLMTPSLSWHWFGQMDDAWLSTVELSGPILFPGRWTWMNWLGIAIQLSLLSGALWVQFCNERSRASLLVAVLIVVIGGVFATWAATQNGYALLVQVQPYRALWILAVLQMPLALWLGCWAYRNGLPWLALAVWAIPFWSCHHLEILFFAFIAASIVGLRLLAQGPRQSDWVWRSVLVSLILTKVCWSFFRFILWFHVGDGLLDHYSGLDLWPGLINTFIPLPLIFLVLGLLRQFGADWARPAAVYVLLGVFLIGHCVAFVAPRFEAYRERFQRDAVDVAFARDFLKQAGFEDRPASVYWSTYHIDAIWLGLRARSYFNTYQLAGAAFHRETALEGKRRAMVVARFELHRFHAQKNFMLDVFTDTVQGLFASAMDGAKPGLRDLERLCREDGVDFAILSVDFPGLSSASNGRVYIYDCRQVRAALARPEAWAAALGDED